LLFVVTPRLAKPLPVPYTLPTDSFKTPNRVEFFLKGQMEGDDNAAPHSANQAPNARQDVPASPQAEMLPLPQEPR